MIKIGGASYIIMNRGDERSVSNCIVMRRGDESLSVVRKRGITIVLVTI